jgi:hypothetical protein
MRDWVLVLGMAHLCGMLGMLLVPSLLLRRDERREAETRKRSG